jgi:FO synthase
MNEQWAVIPVKGLTESKTRLSGYLGDKRRLLVEALLEDVLSSVLLSRVFDRIIVTSPDENVALLGRNEKVEFLKQTGHGLNRAVEHARRTARRENVQSLTTVLADIPLARPNDFAEIFDIRGADPCVVLAPSMKGGTNVMLASPPSTIRPRYGRWSYSKHLRQAQVEGVDVYSVSNPRISLDIDTVEDLMALRRRDAECETRTAQVIRDLPPLLHQARIS